MKRVLASLLVLLMIVSFVACSTQQNENSNGNTEKEKVELKEFNKEATIEETVLVEESGVKIVAKELKYHIGSFEIALTIENNSKEDLSILSGTSLYSCNSINGIMITGGYMNEKVSSGETIEEAINFSYDELALYGIYDIADIELGFYSNDDEYNSNYFDIAQIKTSLYDNYNYNSNCYKESINSNACQSYFDYKIVNYQDSILYENRSVSVVSSFLLDNANSGLSLLLEAVNDNKEQVKVVCSNISINGLMVCSYNWCSSIINPGKRCSIAINLDSVVGEDVIEKLGLNKIGKISIGLQLYDMSYKEVGNKKNVEINISEKDSNFDNSGTELYNSNDIKIIGKDLILSKETYNDYIYLYLIVKNESRQTIYAEPGYSSVCVNGKELAYCSYSNAKVETGMSGISRICLSENDLSEIGIESIEDIVNIEFEIKITNEKYKTIDEAKLKIDYNK